MNTSKKNAAGLAALIGFGALTFGSASPASAQAPLPPTVIGRHGQHRGERHPELRRALRALERTETDLRRSARDFGGHREKAADLCRQAEQEIQQALQDDKS